MVAQCKGNTATAEEVARRAFRIAANFHSLNWGRTSLLELTWLQGGDWRRGVGRGKWEAVQVVK